MKKVEVAKKTVPMYSIGHNQPKKSYERRDDTIIQLKLSANDVKSIELFINTEHIPYDGLPLPFNDLHAEETVNHSQGNVDQTYVDRINADQISTVGVSPTPTNINNRQIAQENSPLRAKKETFDHMLQLMQQKDAGLGPSRKDLIINSGVQKKIHQILTIYNSTWPTHSPYACWLCCHNFNNNPIGIPERYSNGTFYVSGNFCSYNCAKRYLKGDVSDFESYVCLQSIQDRVVNDEKSNKIQLLELMCHLETGLDITEEIKCAPPRLTLSMFGGTLTIDEYRQNFNQHSEYHVFKAPLVPIVYQLEETVDASGNKGKKSRTSSISSDRQIDLSHVESKFNSLIERKMNNNKLIMAKLAGCAS